MKTSSEFASDGHGQFVNGKYNWNNTEFDETTNKLTEFKNNPNKDFNLNKIINVQRSTMFIGDVRKDFQYNEADITMLRKYLDNISGMSQDNIFRCDMNMDGVVNQNDLKLLSAAYEKYKKQNNTDKTLFQVMIESKLV